MLRSLAAGRPWAGLTIFRVSVSTHKMWVALSLGAAKGSIESVKYMSTLTQHMGVTQPISVLK